MTSETTSRRFLAILLLLAIVLVALLMRPLAQALLLAAVLAGVLWPLQRRLTRLFRRRNQLAAGTLVFASVLILVGPVAGFSAFAIDQATSGVTFVTGVLREHGIDGLIERAPGPLRDTLREAMDTVQKHTSPDLKKTLQSKLNDQASQLAAALGGALAATWSLLFNTTMMLIALFFLLAQGPELMHWLERVSPLRHGQTRELFDEFKKTSYAVVVSTLVTATAQALAALIGYLIARVPHPLFFAAITFFGAFIPAIGAASFALLAAGILLITGHPYFALFLAVWAFVVVALVDNVVKPLVMRGGMNMPGAVVFFALVGGIGAFGPIGLILGPLIIAFFVALLRMVRRETLSQPASTARSPAPDSE
jgi:predicted PurR-regulated permease PerM